MCDRIDFGLVEDTEYLPGVNARGGRVWFNGRLVFRTPKAILVEMFDFTKQEWFPTSQTESIGPPDEFGERDIQVSDWIAKQKGIT